MKEHSHKAIRIDGGKLTMSLISPKTIAMLQAFIADQENSLEQRKVAVEVKKHLKKMRGNFKGGNHYPENKPFQMEFPFDEKH